MNAAIRSTVRTGIEHGWEVFGVRRGYAGLLSGDFVPLGARDVGGMIERGGTFLGSSRAPRFREEEAQREALGRLAQHGIDGLVAIGGNGTQAGAHALHTLGFPVVGVASTIDNDLVGSDITIGVDTALRIGMEALDRLKVTAASHERAFLLEVMGRDSGYLALMTAIAGGAEAAVVPEVPVTPEAIADELRMAYERGKGHAIVVVAEGAEYNAEKLARYFRENGARIGFELRVTALGHVQRGGSPGPFDRLLGTRLAAGATAALAAGRHGVLAGLNGGEVGYTPLDDVVGRVKALDLSLFELARVLAK